MQVVVIGAGPAGLMAAVSAAASGASVTVCEQMERPGLKLLATGGGRCNLTNTVPAPDFMARFGRQGRFMAAALSRLDAAALRAFFDEGRVPTSSPDGLHVFPTSNRAADVLECLLTRCRDLRVRMMTGARVNSLVIEGGAVAGVEMGDEALAASSVIVVTGGRSYPKLGATGTGYRLARQAGHEVVEALPALVPLVTEEAWPGTLAGVSLPGVSIRIDAARSREPACGGTLLFTHTGLSGVAALDLSGAAAALLAAGRRVTGDPRRTDAPRVPIRLDLDPTTSAQDLEREIMDWRASAPAKLVHNLLGYRLTLSLSRVLCELAGLGADARAGALANAACRRLLECVKRLPLTVTGTQGFAKAMVTRGGVRLRQVDPRTLESRLVSGLFFAGEVLDLDGPCGGYNLQWAFSSGHLAGLCAAGRG